MPRPIKWLLGAIATFFALTATAAIIAVSVIDPSTYKAEISRQVEAQTGRSLTIAGDASLSLFPWVAIELGRTELGNAPGFEPGNMLSFDKLSARIKLLPLLTGNVQIGAIVVDGLSAELAINAEGKSNWEDLSGTEADADASQAAETEESTPSESSLPALSLASITISKANVHYRDASTGSSYRLSDFNLSTGSIGSNKAAALKVSARTEVSEPAISAELQLSAELTADVDAQRFALQNTELRVRADGEALGGKQQLSLDSDIELDLAKGTASLAGLAIELAELKLQGALNAEGLNDTPSFSGQVDIARFNLRELMASLGQADSLPDTGDPKALTAISASLQVSGSDQEIQLSGLEVALDDSTLRGSASVRQFDTPIVDFNFHLDRIDADHYMASSEEGESESVQGDEDPAAALAETNSTEVDLSALKDLNIKGDIRADELIYSSLSFTKAHIGVNVSQGTATLAPTSLHLYDGKLEGKIVARSHSDASQQSILIQQSLSQLELEPITVALTGEKKATGTGDLQINLRGLGATVGDIRRSLDGNLSFSFLDGSVIGIDIVEAVQQAYALAKGQPSQLANALEAKQTSFASLSASGKVNRGVLRTEDLAMKSPKMQLLGKGDIDLAKETINLDNEVALLKSVTDAEGQRMDEIRGQSIPIKIRGSFSDPEVKVRVDEALKRAAKAKAKEKIDAEKQRAKDKLREKYGEQLNKLFGG